MLSVRDGTTSISEDFKIFIVLSQGRSVQNFTVPLICDSIFCRISIPFSKLSRPTYTICFGFLSTFEIFSNFVLSNGAGRYSKFFPVFFLFVQFDKILFLSDAYNIDDKMVLSNHGYYPDEAFYTCHNILHVCNNIWKVYCEVNCIACSVNVLSTQNMTLHILDHFDKGWIHYNL